LVLAEESVAAFIWPRIRYSSWRVYFLRKLLHWCYSSTIMGIWY